MPAFTRSITIARTPAQVFAVLEDVHGAKQWMPAIRRIDVLTPGMRMGVGFKWRETRRVLGIFRVRVVLAVVQHQPRETLGISYNDGKVRADATFELAPVRGGTKVTFTEEVEDLTGNPARAERMARLMEKQDADVLERLKVHVEATTPASAVVEMTEKEEGAEAPTGSTPAKAKESGRPMQRRAAKATVKSTPRRASGKASKTSKPGKKR